MPIKKIIKYLEISLLFSTWILLIGIKTIVPEINIPYSFEILGAISILCILLFAFSNHENKTAALSLVQAAGVSIVAFGAVQLSKENIAPQMIQYPALYFLIVAGSSFLGGKNFWVCPFIILAGGEIASLFFSGITLEKDYREILLNQNSVYSTINLFILSFFPLIVHRFSRQTQLYIPVPIPQPDSSRSETKNRQPVSAGQPEQDEPASAAKDTPFNHLTVDRKGQNTDNVQDLLYSIVYFMSRNFKAHSALGFIFNPVTQAFELNSFHSKSVCIAKGVSIPLGKGFIGKAGIEKRIFMSGNLPLYNSEILYYSSPVEINSLLAAPIISDQQELLGILVLDCLEKNALRDQDKEIMKRFSFLAAALITNARMRAFQERAAHTFQIFYQASHRFTRALNLDDVFDVLFTTVPTVTSCTRQISMVFDENRNMGKIVRVAGGNNDISPGMEFTINQGLYSFTFQSRKRISIADYTQYQFRYYRFSPDEKKDDSIRSLIIFPITDDEFRCKGVFSIESNEPDQFTGDTEQVLVTLMENASVAFTRAMLYQKMERLATTDGLTGLNNHRNFQEILSKELERARRYKHPVSLLLMDIDHFKTFNDTYGHPVGDLVLQEISLCIQRSIRVNDIPARYGGEEFTVIIPETDQVGAMIIAERVRSTIEKHIIQSLEKQLHVTVSIGCASYPSQASSQQELIDLADKALYYSKGHGRNQATAYLPMMIENGKTQ